MQNRVGIALSLGMLLEKVDASGFIAKLLKKAKEENAEFSLTPELQKQSFLLSEQFNRGEITREAFNLRLLALFGIKTMESDEFWAEWNEMITVGNFAEKILLLQETACREGALIYLYSDTNPVHLEKISKELDEQKIDLYTQDRPMILEHCPLYLSWQFSKNRPELLKELVADIRAKRFNKPDKLILVLGNPDNIQDENLKAVARREFDMITRWANENDVSVSLQNNSLSETLARIFNPENVVANRLKCA